MNDDKKYVDFGYVPCNGHVPCQPAHLSPENVIVIMKMMTIMMMMMMMMMTMITIMAMTMTNCENCSLLRGWKALSLVTITKTKEQDLRAVGSPLSTFVGSPLSTIVNLVPEYFVNFVKHATKKGA